MDTSQTTLFYAILIAGAIITIIIFYFVISVIRYQRRSLALYQSKTSAEITTLENERQRIAADMHDELGPLLTAVRFKINSVDAFSSEDQETMNKVDEDINELIIRLRGITKDLLPNTLFRKGLIVAIKETIEQLKMDNELEIKLAYGILPIIAQDKSMNLYRILLEIIQNTIKHARATELKIEMKMIGVELNLRTADNGTGFDYLTISEETAGIGLRNILKRTDTLNGRMYIQSTPGKGTEFTFEIPL